MIRSEPSFSSAYDSGFATSAKHGSVTKKNKQRNRIMVQDSVGHPSGFRDRGSEPTTYCPKSLFHSPRHRFASFLDKCPPICQSGLDHAGSLRELPHSAKSYQRRNTCDHLVEDSHQGVCLPRLEKQGVMAARYSAAPKCSWDISPYGWFLFRVRRFRERKGFVS